MIVFFLYAPKSLKTINMISFSIWVLFFTMIDETMNVSSCRDASICFPGIRTDNRTRCNFLWDQRLKCISFNVFDDLGPDRTIEAEDPEYLGNAQSPAKRSSGFHPPPLCAPPNCDNSWTGIHHHNDKRRGSIGGQAHDPSVILPVLWISCQSKRNSAQPFLQLSF